MTKARVGDMLVCFRERGHVAGRLPLVLVHGAASSAQVWHEQLRRLGRQRRVVAVDLPGHGCTKAWVDRDVTIRDYARTVLEFVSTLGLGPVVLVGHSMGGAVAIQAALDGPEAVAGLVIGGSAARLPVSDKVFQLVRAQFDSLGEFVAQVAFSPKADPELVAFWKDLPLPATQRTVLADFSACNRFDVRDRLGEIACPVLVVWGADDRMVHRQLVEEFLEGLPAVAAPKFVLLESVGHMLFQEAAEETSRLIEEFVADVERKRAGRAEE